MYYQYDIAIAMRVAGLWWSWLPWLLTWDNDALTGQLVTMEIGAALGAAECQDVGSECDHTTSQNVRS